jgi:hypothetical protein
MKNYPNIKISCFSPTQVVLFNGSLGDSLIRLNLKSQKMRNISIVVNKNWEVEPILAGLANGQFRPAELPFPLVIQSNLSENFRVSASPVNADKNARAIIVLNDGTTDSLTVKIWCIQDFMDPKASSSSSEEKERVLRPLLAAEATELIIAMGTAGYIADNSYAGCVVFGGRFFVHDGDANNNKSHMVNASFEKSLPINVNANVFNVINAGFKSKIEAKLLPPPSNPCIHMTCLASQYYTAVGSVNVTDYGKYAWVDAEAVAAFRQVEQKFPVGSLETTHGVIRLCSEKPTIFISAITDREGNFDMEVNAGQNYVCSFNAGIVLGQFLVDLNKMLIQTPAFDFAKILPQ